MTRPRLVMCGVALSAALVMVPLHAASQAGGAWTTLFNGTNLDAFTTVGAANWTIADGAVEATMGAGHLVTRETYGDFEFRAEFWVSADANSGVFIRCENPQMISTMTAYKVNIFDSRPDPTYRTGAIVNIAKPMSVVMTGGKWNTIVITAKGPRMTVSINDVPMVDVQDSTHARGRIALQSGPGTVKFRNVQIR